MIKISAESRHIFLYFSAWETRSIIINSFLTSPASSLISLAFVAHVSATLNLFHSFNIPHWSSLPSLCHADPFGWNFLYAEPASLLLFPCVPQTLSPFLVSHSPGSLLWSLGLSQSPLYIISIFSLSHCMVMFCPFKQLSLGTLRCRSWDMDFKFI